MSSCNGLLVGLSRAFGVDLNNLASALLLWPQSFGLFNISAYVVFLHFSVSIMQFFLHLYCITMSSRSMRSLHIDEQNCSH